MTNGTIWWCSINSIVIALLYFTFLFSNGDIPKINNRIDIIEDKVDNMDYHLNVSNRDTIVINLYQK